MDFAGILQAVSTVGFPIVCCLAMGWYVKDQTEKNREQIETINEKHKAEIDKVTEALNNNTIALTKLCDKIGGAGNVS